MTRPAHRVLLLIDRLGSGGAAQVVLNMALGLNREEFFPIVCTTRKAPAFGQDDLLTRAGVPLIQLKRTFFWQVAPWRALWKVLPSVSVLHSHESGSNFWGRLWGRLFMVPCIVTQDHTAPDDKKRYVSFIDRAMSSMSDKIVTVSEFDRNLSMKIERLPSEKLMTIYNGIDAERLNIECDKTEARRLAGLPEDMFLLAIVGRLVPQKNHQCLFGALKLLPEHIKSNVRCLVVGSGYLERPLRAKVQSLGLEEVVSFLGERRDVPRILKAIDLLVHPSYMECMPMVILEALSAKCPIVATDVGGIPEVLHGIGWPLIKPGNAGELADAIACVLQMSESEKSRIAASGRRLVEGKFSREASVSVVENLYHSLVNRRCRRPL